MIADVGGNLVMESLQDTSVFDAKQKSSGFSLSLCIPPFCYGASTGSVSAGGSKIQSDYASVNQQTAIKAGDGGFLVAVKGDTALTGAAIASTDQAVQNGRNRFTTGGTLTLSDIQNRADYNADAYDITLSGSTKFGDQTSKEAQSKMTEADKAAAASKTSGLSPSALSGAGTGKDSGSAGSTTRSGISGIAGNTAVRTGDAETGIQKIFDADKVQREIQAQTQITQAFAQQAAQTVDIYAESRMSVLRARYAADPTPENKKALQSEVDQLRLETQVLNVLIGAVTGNGASALTRESLAAGAEEMRKITIENSSLPGKVIDESGGADKPFILSNTSGESAGGKWDLVPTKTGGTRTNLDNICGVDNSRCVTQKDPVTGKPVLDEKGIPKLELKDGMVQWNAAGADNQSLSAYLASEAGQEAAGKTGGIQGSKGTFFGFSYAPGSFIDKLVEAFGGQHDFTGGQITGLYDAQGNTKRGMSEAERFVRDRVSEMALVPAAPFAAATLLPPEMWNAISIFLKAAK